MSDEELMSRVNDYYHENSFRFYSAGETDHEFRLEFTNYAVNIDRLAFSYIKDVFEDILFKITGIGFQANVFKYAFQTIISVKDFCYISIAYKESIPITEVYLIVLKHGNKKVFKSAVAKMLNTFIRDSYVYAEVLRARTGQFHGTAEELLHDYLDIKAAKLKK